jgi:hypothetical protein
VQEDSLASSRLTFVLDGYDVVYYSGKTITFTVLFADLTTSVLAKETQQQSKSNTHTTAQRQKREREKAIEYNTLLQYGIAEVPTVVVLCCCCDDFYRPCWEHAPPAKPAIVPYCCTGRRWSNGELVAVFNVRQNF